MEEHEPKLFKQDKNKTYIEILECYRILWAWQQNLKINYYNRSMSLKIFKICLEENDSEINKNRTYLFILYLKNVVGMR